MGRRAFIGGMVPPCYGEYCMSLTESQKLELYRAGKYLFSPPPVYHENWDELAWIRYIDMHGTWII